MPDEFVEFLDTIDSAVADQPAAAESAAEVQPVSVETKQEPPAAESVKADKGETDAPPASELPPRSEDGKFKKRDSEDHMVPLSALMAERERRQAAERSVEEQAKKGPPPNFWDDPQAAVQAALDAKEGEFLSKAEVKARETFFRFTENAAQDRHTDYGVMREAFIEASERNPVLAAQLRDAPDPAEFIYQQGRIASELREVGGDLSAYRKRVEASVRQQVEQEHAAKAARTDSIPTSLNTESSKGAGISGGQWAGPTPLEDILPRGKET